MAFGLPVISFDCENGPRSIISDGKDGILIPPFEIEIFANKLMQLMGNLDIRKRFGENGLRKSQQYSIDSVGNKWKQLFEELIHNDGV